MFTAQSEVNNKRSEIPLVDLTCELPCLRGR